ncbi:MAG: hypothetical protein OH316_02255 [Candidatus Parvarchaeota archaeon]|nr:hypothetical protein [Candidatus Parvarchaeota archaeon]MCW1301934.1 hypothetical protein [Candidatus Parvarchaeota archaeon]
MKKLTVELIVSALIVSFIEVVVLYFLGIIKSSNLYVLIVITVVFTVIELVLVFVIEELLILARNGIRESIKRRR